MKTCSAQRSVYRPLQMWPSSIMKKKFFQRIEERFKENNRCRSSSKGAKLFFPKKIPTSSIPGSCNIYLEGFHNFYIPVMAMCLSSLLFFKESVCCHNHVLVSLLYVGEGEKTFHFIHLSLNQEKAYSKLT